MTDHFPKPSDAPAALPRRTFIRGVIAGGGLLAAGGTLSATESLLGETAVITPACRGPNVVLILCGWRSAHAIFALFVGAGVPRDRVVDRRVDQSQAAATLGRLMGFNSDFDEQRILEEAIA